jgi:ribulose-5-phosphate 4-epimerase/fuculose-1-phosphate aldolase
MSVAVMQEYRPGNISEAEWQTRVDLAAAYRLCAHFGMTDGIYSHISAAVPGEHGHFLINPLGWLFQEVTATCLVKIDFDGNKVGDSPYDVNPAGFTIHSAVHMARPELTCVLHTHTQAGVSVSCQKGGLLPLSQWSFEFYDRLAYHDYCGIAFDLAERESLVADLGSHYSLMLRNHGLLTCAPTIPLTFKLMHDLDRACESQLHVQASGAEINWPSKDVCEKTAQQYDKLCADKDGKPSRWITHEWDANLRLLEQLDGTPYWS